MTEFRNLTEDELKIVAGGDNPIIVIGYPNYDGGGGGGGGGYDTSEGGHPGDGGGMGGPLTVPPEDCVDRKALEAENLIERETDDDTREHAVLIYTDANGQTQKSNIIQGGGTISQAALTQELQRLGVSWSQVVGFVHNHPQEIYGSNSQEEAANRYPSGGGVPGGDWNAAEWMVSQGAGGPNGQNFSLYVIDADPQEPHMREFRYADRAYYETLTRDERIAGVNLPPILISDGSRC
jgi:hypothetical protein